MLVQKIGEVAHANGIKAILHGPPGSGKTMSIASIPDRASVLVLSAEAGLLSLRNVGADIDTVIIRKLDDLREAYTLLNSADGVKYNTIVLDSLTEIAQQVLVDEMSKTKDGRQAYGALQDTMLTMVKRFRDLEGRNVLLICQQERTQDDTGRIYAGPSMPGKKLGPQIQYMVDLVGCMRVRSEPDGSVRRAIQFDEAADILFSAKDRSGALGSFEPVDWSLIFGKINNKNNGGQNGQSGI